MSVVRNYTLVSAGGSLLLSVGLWVVYFFHRSELVQGQAADSLMDVFTGTVLAFTVQLAARESDERHPFGHRSAEPLGAMFVAVMAGVLAYRVGSSALDALMVGRSVAPRLGLAWAFGLKMVFKAAIVVSLWPRLDLRNSVALRALFVDARNDVLLSLSSVLGLLLADWGFPLADPGLALPIAVWIGWSGFDLARDNVRLLMGEAPPEARQRELVALAAGVVGVLDAHDLRAQFVGTHLAVHVHISVDRNLRVDTAHDIGEKVRILLESESDVDRCQVHVDAADVPP